jgi:hypothetical protein
MPLIAATFMFTPLTVTSRAATPNIRLLPRAMLRCTRSASFADARRRQRSRHATRSSRAIRYAPRPRATPCFAVYFLFI